MGEPGKKAEDAFVNKYKGSEYLLTVPLNISESQRRKAFELIFDYVALTTKGEKQTEDRFWKYGERKYDMFHVLSSTLLSLILGFVLGTAIRLYYQFFIFDARFIIDEVVLPELCAYIFLLVSFVSLIFLIRSVRRNVEDEYCKSLISIARHCKPNVDDLRRAFPDYFKKNEKT